MEIEEEKRKGTFDRGIDFDKIKLKLVSKIGKLYKLYNKAEKHMLMNQLVYCIIALIQLRNGSRISEAVKAFKYFMENGIKTEADIKISKSDAVKTVTRDGVKTKIKLQARFRDMFYPQSWIDDKIFKCVQKSEIAEALSGSIRLKKRVLDYLLKYFECNTHSLRYAFINHMLYTKKLEMTLVATMVGHANCNQLVTYTQKKNVKSELAKADI